MTPDEMIYVTRTVVPPLEDYVRYLRKIWSARWLTNDGSLVQLLNQRLEEHLGVKNLVLLSNGTIAIQITLKTLPRAGEVVTTPFTFSATTNAIVWEGLSPVFADIDSETFNVDPAEVERKITGNTVAILATHVYGNPCDVDRLAEVAARHKLTLIFDAAHAFGVEYKNRSILSYGDVSTLSFHATKVFHTIEGGGIVARDEKLVDTLKLLRNHGIRSEEEVVLPGTNAKMNEFQAAMGLCNLERIDAYIESRRLLYERYKAGLSGAGVKFQKVVASRYNYIYMPVCFKDIEQRDHVHAELLKNRVKARKYFFPLTTDFKYFRQDGADLVEKYGLKHARDVSNRVLCLPLYPDLEAPVVDDIITTIQKLVSQ